MSTPNHNEPVDRKYPPHLEVVELERRSPTQGIYLLHFNKPVDFPKIHLYGNETHYIGCSTDIEERIAQHQNGEGAKMTTAALEQGITMTLAAVYPLTHWEYSLVQMEQIITRVNDVNTLCPICHIKAFVPKPKPKVVKTYKNHTCSRCGDTIYSGSAAVVEENGLSCYRHHKE